MLLAVYSINRMPTPVLAGKSSYELFHKKSPSMKHMRVPGCLCYATSSIIGDKFQPRAVRSVLMGYSAMQKGYLLFDLTHKKKLLVEM